MRKFKKATSKLAMGLTAAAMALSGTAMSAIPTFAYDYIPLPTESEIVISTSPNYFYFTPEESGEYRFYSYDSGESDPLVQIYLDPEQDEFFERGDDEVDLNFEVVRHFEAGTTYYFVVENYETGTYKAKLEKISDGDNPSDSDDIDDENGTGDNNDDTDVDDNDNDDEDADRAQTTTNVKVVCIDANGGKNIKEIYISGVIGESLVIQAPKIEKYNPRLSSQTLLEVEENHYIEFVYDKETISINNASVSGLRASYNYTGKNLTPAVTVKNGSTTLVKNTDYTVEYTANKAVGTAKVTIKGKGNYSGTITKTFKITKAANPLKASVAKKTVKVAKVKKAKQTVAGAIKATKAQGKVTYTKVTKGSSKYLSVSKTTGKITVKKGTPKGTHKIKVAVKAAGNGNYKAATKTVTAQVQVK